MMPVFNNTTQEEDDEEGEARDTSSGRDYNTSSCPGVTSPNIHTLRSPDPGSLRPCVAALSGG